MFIFKKTADLRQYIDGLKASIGFVPTMGALHSGHLSLIEKAKQENKIVICSIFINPTQFNDKKDFDRYPVTLQSDIERLDQAGTDVLFLPGVDEIYPHGIDEPAHFELGYLDTVLDGKFRPGHFTGVCNVVNRLMRAVKPDKLYLGEKDYQQCLVIKRLLTLTDNPAELVICPTRREANGLAMSSRNELLSKGARERASAIFYCLKSIREESPKVSFSELQKRYITYLNSNSFDTEYIVLADAETLEFLPDFDQSKKMVVLIATKMEGVRLIDNLKLN
jgi:pantoate--beta-alanine ligase